MKMEFSFDDGHEQDIRVAQMLLYYGIRATFYIPAINRGIRGEGAISNGAVKILSRDHDIGFHSWSHPRDLKEIEDDTEIRRQVSNGRQNMEGVIGRPITSFCYPRGKYDFRATQAVMAAGYTEARTVDVGHTSATYDPFRKPTTVHIHPKRVEYGIDHWTFYAKHKLAQALADADGYFHMWGHGWEIERYALWGEFEEMLKHLAPIYEGLHATRQS